MKSDLLMHLLLALAAVMAVGRLMGMLFARIGQPPVIGEVVAGILLGPSFLRGLAPGMGSYLLPDGILPTLGMLSQLGVILYMFVVGLELNLSDFKGRGKATLFIANLSIAVPFVLGAGLALWLYPRFSDASVPEASFALFMGVAMAITAFPVLARILGDTGMARSPLGQMALACAALNDATAWLLLAGVLSLVQSAPGHGAQVAGGAAAFGAFMVFAARPWLNGFAARNNKAPLSRGTVALVLWMVLLSATATELIGIHAIFGAFLLGALIPHDSAIAREFEGKLKDLVSVLLLPAFFAFTGMRTQIGLVSGGGQWLALLLIILTATLGKFGGAALAAKISGMSGRDSAALGILMNTRGLVELIVLNVGLDLQIISPSVFTMMVLMALFTTMATAPALRLVLPAAKK